MAETTKVLNCSICGDEIDDPFGMGHNPAPVKNGDDDRCCDSCNWNVVVPARLREIQAKDD